MLQADLQLSNTASWMNSVDRILIDSSHNQSVEQHLAAKHPQLNRWFQSAGHDLVEPNQEFTVFAPTDQAFRDLPWPLAERLYVNRNLLRDLLANHIVPGIHYSVGLLNRSVRARSGLLLHTTLTNDQLQVNGIDLIDRDLVVQHGVVHPIRQVLLSAEVLRDCNCLEPAELSDIVNRVKNNRAPANSTREARYVSPLVHSRDRLNVNEHFKRHFRNLTNLAYESKNQTKPLKPMVIYDQSDAWPYQTAGSSSARRFQPVAYHTNHNYADLPLSSSALPDGRLYVHEFYNSSNSRNQSILNRNIDLNLSPPALPLYNPFMPIRNYTLQHHHAPYAGISFPLDPPTNLNPPPLPPAFSPRQPSYQILPVSIIDAAQLSPSQFKFLNDLTTPTSIHFDPTRRPKQLRTDPILINHPRLEPMEPQSSARLQTNPQPRLNPMEAQLAYYPTKSPTRPASNTEAPKSAAVMLTLNEVIREPRLELDGHPARFAIFEHLLNQSGLNGLTTGNSQVSLFLPNDQAFLRLTRTQRLLLGITSRRMRNKRDQDSIDRLRQSNLIRHLILSHISPVLVRPTSIDRKGISIEAFSNYSLHLHRQGSV